MDSSSRRIAAAIGGRVRDELERLGFLFRVFDRAKTRSSFDQKVGKKRYAASGRKMQDAVGVRVALYFADDVDIVIEVIKALFVGQVVDATIDSVDVQSFKPQRINLVFSLRKEEAAQVLLVRECPDLVDATFEVQIRTVLSEGWHEVEHDLRYKCTEDWEKREDLGRAMNGIAATLETCDWSMLQLFDELAHRHYREQRWEGMLRAKMRLRLSGTLAVLLQDLLTERKELARKLFRSDRERIIRAALESRVAVPLTFDNVVFLINWVVIGAPEIEALAPEPIRDVFARARASVAVSPAG